MLETPMPQSACQRQVYLMLGQLPDPAADKERLRRDLESLTQIIAAAGASHQNLVAATALFGNEAAVSR
jgi:hypothetical protein